jgi:hypothetical protein
VIRRAALRGGATDEEVSCALPGDDLIPVPALQTTHAIDIAAPPAVVWRWLIQCGFRGAGRAGWYSDSWLDRVADATLFKLTVPKDGRARTARSADELIDGIDEPRVGDVIPDGPPGTAEFVVKLVVHERAWVLHSTTHLPLLGPLFLRGTRYEVSGSFTWVFVLRPTARGTRLILRTRGDYQPAWFRLVGKPLLYLGEAILPAAILRGFKRRCERHVSAGAAYRGRGDVASERIPQ